MRLFFVLTLLTSFSPGLSAHSLPELPPDYDWSYEKLEAHTIVQMIQLQRMKFQNTFPSRYISDASSDFQTTIIDESNIMRVVWEEDQVTLLILYQE